MRVRSAFLAAWVISATFLASVSAKVVTIDLVCNDPPEIRPGTYEKAIKLFEASHPGVKVRYTLANSEEFVPYLLVRAAAGTLPDVFYHRCQYTQPFASKGLIKPLDAWVKRDKLSLDDFWTPQLPELSYNGKLYALPENYSSWGVSYNVEVAAQAGVTIPTTAWSWEDLRAVAAKLVRKDGNKVVRYGFQYRTWDVWAMLGMFHGKSGQVYSSDLKSCTIANPMNAKLLDMFANMQTQGIIPPGGAGDFPGKKVAMSYDGSWCTDYWRKQLKGNHFDIAYAPTGDSTGKPSVGNSGAGYVVAANSKHPQEAWELVKFLTSEMILDDVFTVKLINIPGRKSSAGKFAKTTTTTGDPRNVRIWLDSAEKGWSIPSTPVHTDLISSLRTNLGPWWTGKKTGAQALALVEQEVNLAMKRKESRR